MPVSRLQTKEEALIQYRMRAVANAKTKRSNDFDFGRQFLVHELFTASAATRETEGDRAGARKRGNPIWMGK